MNPNSEAVNQPQGNVLIVSHKEEQCGVHQFGLNLASALNKSAKYAFEYIECSGTDEYFAAVEKSQPKVVIYNYHPSTLPWLNRKIIRKIGVPRLGIIHEVTQELADGVDNSLFDYHIAADPVLLLKNPLVFKTGRLIQKIENTYPMPVIPTIGSFGFATEGKGFDKLVSTVQEEFDNAVIRLNIPFATFADASGSSALAVSKKCEQMIVKPGIKLLVSHEFLSVEKVLDFLAQNSVNAFFYEQNDGRGISSVTDLALAVRRPVAITRSTMFRHLHSVSPSICIEDSSLTEIINHGFGPVAHFCEEWNEDNLIWDYERIVESVLSKTPISRFTSIRQNLRRIFQKTEPEAHHDSWIPALKQSVHAEQVGRNLNHEPVLVTGIKSYNRILNESARKQYKPCIDELFDLLPDMMARKIPEANIQQAFVLDTVNEFIDNNKSAKILCVGSYDDTAFAALRKYGYRMDEVDPVLNYDLNTFMHKPSTKSGSYDIVFSTSVIEHVRDDELFVTQIAELLSPGGVAILTCDYNDQYKPGDSIPSEDFHMYTQKDLLDRLIPLLKDCSLVDVPQWDCSNPDFVYADYRYTFASLVFRKNAV